MTRFYRVCRRFLIIIFSLIYPKKVVNMEKLPEEGPVVLCSNHKSYIDPVFLAISQNRQLNFMAKEELFENKFFAWLIRNLGAFPINRDSVDTSAIRHSIKVLKNGEMLVVFIEGGRKKGKVDPETEEAKQGAAMLADRTGALICPCYIGSYKLFKKTKVEFKDPISPEDYRESHPDKKERYKIIADETLKRIYEGEKIED